MKGMKFLHKPIITVNDLNLWYGQTQALKHINIEIPEKSITALIGLLWHSQDDSTF